MDYRSEGGLRGLARSSFNIPESVTGADLERVLAGTYNSHYMVIKCPRRRFMEKGEDSS